MRRLQKIIDHWTFIDSASSLQLDPSSNSDFTFKISDKYICRLLNASDHQSVVEICSFIYGGADFIALYFHRYLNDDTITIFGCEYVPNSKVVAIALVQIIDGGITAFGFGGRMHPDHQGKGVFGKLLSWIDQLLPSLAPNVKRIRATTFKSMQISLKLQQKMKMYYLPNYAEYICCHIIHPNIGNDMVWHRDFMVDSNEFSNRLHKIGIRNDQMIKMERIFDIDKIIKILKVDFGKKTLCLDWKVFDLTGLKCINDATLYLNKEFKSKRLKCWIDSDYSCLCLEYIDKRPNVIQFYISGEKNSKTLLWMINTLYAKWMNHLNKNNDDSMHAYDCRFFIDKDVVNNANIKTLCKGFDSHILSQKIL